MKAGLLFLMIACTALLCSTGNATTADNANPQQKARPPLVSQGRHNATAHERTPKSVSLPKPASPRRTPNTSKGAVVGKTINGRRKVSEQRSSATIKARSVRPSTVSRTAVSAPNDVRHHGANPATIGGPRSTTVSSTAALNGRAVNRRP